MSSSTARRNRGLPVVLVLAVLAAIPLVGVVMLSTREVSSAVQERSRVKEVEILAEDAILMGELRTAFVSERNWFLIERGLEEVRLPPDFVQDVAGVNVVAELQTARAKTDGLFELLATRATVSPSVAMELAHSIRSIRTSDQNTPELLARYSEPQLLVDAASNQIFRELLRLSRDLPNGDGLARTVEVLGAAERSRVEVAVQQAAIYATLFDLGQDLNSQYFILLDSDSSYQDSIGVMEELSEPDSRTTSALAILNQDPDVIQFRQIVNDKVEDALANGNSAPKFKLSMLSDIISGFQVIFSASVASVERHNILLEAGGDDLAAVASQLESESNSRVREASLIGGLFLLASGLAVLGSMRMLVRPLDQLAQSAADLSSGTSHRSVSRKGPMEVREAARAIEAADTNLALAQEQALALASGNLDDPSLSTEVRGNLGSSLQDAVKMLAETIKRNEEFSKRLEHEATHDSLTGIANRSASIEAIKAAICAQVDSGSALAVMFIDLDGFKSVNDRLGHQVGDTVLQEVSRRLENALRPGDHVGRLGGDEFVVVAAQVSDLDEAVMLGQRLVGAVCAEMTFDGVTVGVGASVGLAFGSPEDDLIPEQLLSDADLAVYRAKGLGSGRVEVCDDQLRQQVALEASLTEALRRGLDRGEFRVHYQAVVSPEHHQLKSLEALVRWDRPGHGLLEAANFIEFADRSDLIVEIDRQVLDIVSTQMREWSSHSVLGDIPISVNISGRNLSSNGFVGDIIERVENGELDPTRLTLEVKENSLFENLDLHAPRLQRLRDVGIQIAIDNFGTGYTSLAQMRHLPVDILKIDSSFVSSVTRSDTDRDLIKMIMATGQILGATILAEGVETTEQAERMVDLGTDEMQGYLFSRSLPASELLEALGIDA